MTDKKTSKLPIDPIWDGLGLEVVPPKSNNDLLSPAQAQEHWLARSDVTSQLAEMAALSPSQPSELVTKRKEMDRLRKELADLDTPAAVDLSAKGAPAPMARFRAQELAIVEMIKTMGLTAKALPRNIAGKPGAKADIRDAMKQSSLFVGSEIFDKAWERLRARGDICDSRSPTLGYRGIVVGDT